MEIKRQKKLIMSSLIALGLFSAANAHAYVNQLDTKQLSKLSQTLQCDFVKAKHSAAPTKSPDRPSEKGNK